MGPRQLPESCRKAALPCLDLSADHKILPITVGGGSTQPFCTSRNNQEGAVVCCHRPAPVLVWLNAGGLHMSISRKLLPAVALAGLAATLLVLPGSPGAAAPLRTPGAVQATGKDATAPIITTERTGAGGGCSAYVESGFHWSQAACLWWDARGIVGSTWVSFETGFNRDHVRNCYVEATLVSSYGTTHTVYDSCLVQAHLGGTWAFPRDYSNGETVGSATQWKFGFGRNSGDTYSLHACMHVYTGNTYNSCDGPHPSSPNLTILG